MSGVAGPIILARDVIMVACICGPAVQAHHWTLPFHATFMQRADGLYEGEADGAVRAVVIGPLGE